MPTPAARLLPSRDQTKPTGEFPLFQILAKERRQLVERNEAHAIVEVHVASALNDQQFLGFGSPLVGIFTELPGMRCFTRDEEHRTGRDRFDVVKRIKVGKLNFTRDGAVLRQFQRPPLGNGWPRGVR